jgi:hypothetical protein
MSYKNLLFLFSINFGLISCGIKSYSEEDVTPNDIFYQLESGKSCLYIKKTINEDDVKIRSLSISENTFDKKFLYKKFSDNQELMFQNCLNVGDSLDSVKYKMKNNEKYYISIDTNYTNINFFQCFYFDGKYLNNCK